MTARLEHANLAVHDVDGIIAFLRTAFPEFKVRHQGHNADGMRWVHIGTDENYLALNEATGSDGRMPYSGMPGLNHLGFEIEDADEVRSRLLGAGYQESAFATAHPFRKRIYFYDSEGNDWEFVQYLTSDAEKRNDYADAV